MVGSPVVVQASQGPAGSVAGCFASPPSLQVRAKVPRKEVPGPPQCPCLAEYPKPGSVASAGVQFFGHFWPNIPKQEVYPLYQHRPTTL